MEKQPDYDILEGQKIPVGRLAKPDEVAAVISLLLRPDAAYLQGIELNADGGWLACGNMLPGQAATDRDAYVELVNLVTKTTASKAA